MAIKPAFAATGINSQINFQGKLVGPTGLNVADSTYSVVFTLYDASSGGTNLWDETQSVSTTDGIFQVQLGSIDTSLGNVDFNTDNLYLGIKVGADAEMTPRIRFAAVPYAFNAQKVAGLTVTNTTGTLTIPNGKTIQFADSFTTTGGNALILATTGSTSITLPTTGTLLTNTATSNQTVTSTQTSGTILGLTDATNITGATTGLAINMSGTGAFDQTGLSFNLSGATGSNTNDIVGSGGTWKVSRSGDLTVNSCTGCTGGMANYWRIANGAFSPVNDTADLLIGNAASASAKFGFLNVANGGTPTASISANSGNNATYLMGTGILSTTNKQTLTLGQASTGNIVIGTDATARTITIGNNTGASALAFTSGTSAQTFTSSATSGTAFSLVGNSVNTGTGLGLTANGLTNGNAVSVTSTATALGSGRMLNISKTGASGSTAFTGDIANVAYSQTFNGGVGLNHTGNVMDLSRAITLNAAQTHTISGALMTLSDSATQTSGTLNSSADVLAISQNYTANTGAALNVTTAGTGYALRVNDDGTLTDSTPFVIEDNGNVGIGLTSPTGMLHVVNGTAGQAGIRLTQHASQSTSPFLIEDSSSTPMFTIDQFGGAYISNGLTVARYAGIGTSGSSGTQLRIQTIDVNDIGFDTTGMNGQVGDLARYNPSFGVVGAAFDESANLRIGIGAPDTGKLNVTGGYTGKALAIFNETGNQDVLTASVSGATKFVVRNNGDVYVAANQIMDTLTTGTLGIGTGNATTLTLGRSGQNIALPGYNNCGMLTTSGTTLTCSSAPSAGTQYVRLNNGAFSLVNDTADFLIGNTSSASAKFAFLNVNSGTPTASVSGSVAGYAASLNGDGVLTTTLNRTLSLNPNGGNVGIGTGTAHERLTVNGGAAIGATFDRLGAALSVRTTNTSDQYVAEYFGQNSSYAGFLVAAEANNAIPFIQFADNAGSSCCSVTSDWTLTSENANFNFRPGNAVQAPIFTLTNNGSVGINAVSQTATLDVRGNTGTSPVASFSGTTARPALMVDNNGVGDLFAASKSGARKFVINNSGQIGLAGSAVSTGFNITAPNFLVENDGNIYATALNNLSDSSNAQVSVDATGTNISRNVADSNVALTVTQSHASSTGDILQLANDTNTVFRVARNGSVGVGATTPLATFDVRGNSGTTPVSSVSGVTARAAMVVDNNGVGDIFTASKSGATKFVINNSGNVGIGVATADSTFSIKSSNSNAVLNAYGTTGFTDYGVLQVSNAGGLANPSYRTLAIQPNGGRILLGSLGSSQDALAKLDVRGESGTEPVTSVSGQTARSAFVVDQSGVGDLFVASKSGATKFAVLNNGNISMANYNNCGMLTTVGTVLTCSSAPAGGTNYWNLASGTLAPVNTTLDLLVGGTASASAKFAVLGMNTGTPTASISATGTGNGVSLGGDGTIQSLRRNTLTIGGSTTGDITFRPGGVASGNSLYLASNGSASIGTSDVSSGKLTIGGTYANAASNYAGLYVNPTFSQTGNSSNAYKGMHLQALYGDSFNLGELDGSTSYGTFYGSGTLTILRGAYSQASTSVGITGNVNYAQGSVGDVQHYGTGTISDAAGLVGSVSLRSSGTGNDGEITGAAGVVGYVENNLSANTGTIGTGTAIYAGAPTASANAPITNTRGVYVENQGSAGVTNAAALYIEAQSGASSTNYAAIFAGGRIGMGTTAPLAALDVRSSGAAAGTVPVASVSGLTSMASLVVNNNGVGDLFTASKSGATKFVIANSGNVGIGTILPAARLAVAGAGTGTVLMGDPGFGGNYAGIGLSGTLASSTYTFASGPGDANLYINRPFGGDMIFHHAAGTQMRLTSGGNLAINTNTALATLDVRGTSGSTPAASFSATTTTAGLVVDNDGTGDLLTASKGGATKVAITNAGTLAIGAFTRASLSTTPKDQLHLWGNGTFGSNAIMHFGDVGNDSNAYIKEATTGDSDQLELGGRQGLIFATGTDTSYGFERMRIDANGNVGIGDTTPNSKLDVGGTVTNTGSLQNLSMVVGNDSDADGLTGLTVSVTSASTGDADTVYGIDIDDLSGAGSTVTESALRLGSGWDNEMELADSTPNIKLSATDNTADLTFTDSASNTLLRMRDMSTNFGAALYAGAFINFNSMVAEEFNRTRTTVTNAGTDTTGGQGGAFGNGGGWGVYGNGANCTFSTLADTVNGITRIAASTANRGCMTMIDDSLNNAKLMYNVSNLPVIVMKIRPSQADATSGVYAGLGDSTDGIVTAPTNFIGFSNDNAGTLGNTWRGITRSGGTSTTLTCTGQTVSTTQFALLVVEVRSSTSVRFFMDNDVSNGVNLTECGAGSTTNIYTSNLAPQIHWQERTGGAASNLDLDFYRTWQDDAPMTDGLTASAPDALTFDETASESATLDTHDVVMSTLAQDELSDEATVADGTTGELLAGLDPLKGRISDLENKIASMEAKLGVAIASPSATVLPSEMSSNSAETTELVKTDNLSVAGLATVSANLRVQGNGLIEGILNVVDTLTVSNFIVNKTANFFADVIFHSDVFFRGTPYFNKDTAGYVTITKGSDKAEITFSKPYKSEPVVNASVVATKLSDEAFKKFVENDTCEEDKGREMCEQIVTQEAIEESMPYVIGSRSNEGFTILLSQPATQDLTFSWSALAVIQAEELVKGGDK